MKPRMIFIIILVMIVALPLTLVVSAQESSVSPNFLASPTPTMSPSPYQLPYIPFTGRETFPDYLLNKTTSKLQPKISLTKPAGIDLDVTYISRSPMYNRYDVSYTAEGKPYLTPGTENDKRWPSPGELVTFTAHIINKGTIASGSFSFKWFIDEGEVQAGTLPSLNPGEEGITTYQWAWAHTLNGEQLLGTHKIRFTADPPNAISETYKSNNSLEDRTDAISLFITLSPDLYNALETPVDSIYPFSAEDWLQKQITAMNAAFIRSVFPNAPSGITERVRLDKIVITSEGINYLSEDGGIHGEGDARYVDGYYDPATDVSGGMLHELAHQLGMIDLYHLNMFLEIPQVLDRLGRPVQMEYWPGGLFPGLMNNPGIKPPIFDEDTALALNSNKGFRRGYFGEYLYDVPKQTYLRVLDNLGNPAPGVSVKLYQFNMFSSQVGSPMGTIDNIPEISGVTDSAGLVLLPNRPVGTPTLTNTGHTLGDNPFGVIDVGGANAVFLIEITKGAHQEFAWTDITRFNLATWRGGSSAATIDIPAHVPPASAPLPPASLSGILEYGLVKLQWLPSPSAGVVGYNVYRASDPVYLYQPVLTGTTASSYTNAYDYNARAAQYVVTAVDAQGRESGFSNIFYALRISNPVDIVVDESNRRIVLDAQNGYPLLNQVQDGTFVDTLNSISVEFSHYLARDWQGHLLISHPGDFYSARQSVRVTDENANLLSEFGEIGSGPGQFNSPAGIAIRGQPCNYDGPYQVDDHTLLLLHFDGSLNGAQGEIPSTNGVTFASGKYGQGASIIDTAFLSFGTTGNFLPKQGAIEFWVKPSWPGSDGYMATFIDIAEPSPYPWTSLNQFWLWMDYFYSGSKPKLVISDSTHNVTADSWVPPWIAGQWYHVAGTWQQNEKIRIYVNGKLQGESNEFTPLISSVAENIYIGSSAFKNFQARSVIDELRISDIPRVGNSDTCTYRIIVADSGNNRIQAFDSLGNFVSAFGSNGNGAGQFNNPQGVAIASNGDIIIADSGNNRLQVLSYDGINFNFIRAITADFNGPTGLAAIGNRIIVADTGNSKIKVLNTQGSLLAQYTAPTDGRTGIFNQPRGVAVDHDGNIVVADTGNQRVVTIINAFLLLSVDKTGTGSGTVTSSPAGINCGSACSAPFDNNSRVILTASASTGSTFTGWSGSGCTGANTCTVAMDASKSVMANFDLIILPIYLPLVIR